MAIFMSIASKKPNLPRLLLKTFLPSSPPYSFPFCSSSSSSDGDYVDVDVVRPTLVHINTPNYVYTSQPEKLDVKRRAGPGAEFYEARSLTVTLTEDLVLVKKSSEDEDEFVKKVDLLLKKMEEKAEVRFTKMKEEILGNMTAMEERLIQKFETVIKTAEKENHQKKEWLETVKKEVSAEIIVQMRGLLAHNINQHINPWVNTGISTAAFWFNKTVYDLWVGGGGPGGGSGNGGGAPLGNGGGAPAGGNGGAGGKGGVAPAGGNGGGAPAGRNGGAEGKGGGAPAGGNSGAADAAAGAAAGREAPAGVDKEKQPTQ